MLPLLRRLTQSKPATNRVSEVLFYPARGGELLNGRYTLVRQLGVGTATRSTVWSSKDARTGDEVALKIIGADSTEVGKFSQCEVSFLNKVARANPSHAGYQHVIHMRESFDVPSTYGSHTCLVLDLYGTSLGELHLSKSRANHLSLVNCKRIIRQILLGLDYLHRCCGIVHTDLKPDNFLLSFKGKDLSLSADLPLPPFSVVVSDLGVASWSDDPYDGVVSPYALRAPEIYIRAPWGPSLDIWSMGCLSYELVVNQWLFNPQARGGYSMEDDHLASMIELLGGSPFPADFLARGRHTNRYFDESGNLLKVKNLDPVTLLQVINHFSKLKPEDKPDLFADFLERMLRLHPDHREPAWKLAQHPWLQIE